ncbi:MAG: RNA polymerase sigma factor [Phycisphaerales bacterium]
MLCAAAAMGDTQALQRLLVMHHVRLLRCVERRIGVDWRGRIDAEDVLQEAYGSACATIAKFVYLGEDSFYQWVSRIADQRFIDRVRSARRKKRDSARDVGQVALGSRFAPLVELLSSPDPRVSRVVRSREAAAAVMAALATLPEDYRQVVGRLYLERASVRVVATELGRTEDAVRRLAGRALERLREELGGQSRWI